MGRNSRAAKLSLEEDFAGEVDEDAQAAKAFAESNRKPSKRARREVEAEETTPEADVRDDVSDSASEHRRSGEDPEAKKDKPLKRQPTSKPEKLDKATAGKDRTSSSRGDSADAATGEDEVQKYERYILFVGQIPFDATADEIARHFADHGAGKVRVRLLSDKKTGKSRGMAFVDFENAPQLVRGLRVHHTRLRGRAINVERTVGGGGNNDARKEKLKELREFQGSRVRREVNAIVEETIANSKGALTTKDADELVVQSLCALPRDAAKQVMEEVLESDIGRARNKKAWILGCIKRYTARLKTGEQFLKLGEEKAGIIEKQKKQQHSSKGRDATAPSSAKRGHPSTVVTGQQGSSSKFKRGRIGS